MGKGRPRNLNQDMLDVTVRLYSLSLFRRGAGRDLRLAGHAVDETVCPDLTDLRVNKRCNTEEEGSRNRGVVKETPRKVPA